jgi:hypothetical protein
MPPLVPVLIQMHPVQIRKIRPIPKPCVTFLNKIILLGEVRLAPRPTHKVQDRLLSAVHDLLFNIYAAAQPQMYYAPCRGDRGPKNIEI